MENPSVSWWLVEKLWQFYELVNQLNASKKKDLLNATWRIVNQSNELWKFISRLNKSIRQLNAGGKIVIPLNKLGVKLSASWICVEIQKCSYVSQ